MRANFDPVRKELLTMTFIRFMHLSHQTAHHLNTDLLKKNNINKARFILLREIILNGGQVTMSKLALATYTKRSNITGLIEGMLKKGLVESIPDKTDRRYMIIKSTEKGRKLFEESLNTEAKMLGTLFRGFTQKQITQLNILIDKLLANIEQEA